jgi:hypothetical protein
VSGRDSTFLRGQLASVGILLEPATLPSSPPAPAVPTEPPPVDRDEVHAILMGAGAPAGDLDWLIASCPSVKDARGYRPPPRHAWCVDCGGVTACDDPGCIACRGVR